MLVFYMEYELYKKRHSSVEMNQWLESTVIEYTSKKDGEDSFRMYGGGGINNLCFLVSEPFCFTFRGEESIKKLKFHLESILLG
jgi:hypothetical protein